MKNTEITKPKKQHNNQKTNRDETDRDNHVHSNRLQYSQCERSVETYVTLVAIKTTFSITHNQYDNTLTLSLQFYLYINSSSSEIGLDSKKEILDKQGLEIANLREKSSQARKLLAQETKSFKKLKDAEKLTRFSKLLKNYQDEIDALTKRSLSSETFFLELYNELREAPDPSLVIDELVSSLKNVSSLASSSSSDTTASHDANIGSDNSNERSDNSIEEIERLKNQLKHYEEEFVYLKDQDVKIHSLEKKVTEYENNMTKLIESELETKMVEWNRERDEYLAHYREKEQILAQQSQSLRSELVHLQQLYETAQNELFDIKLRNEQNESQRQTQFLTLNEEVATLNQSIVSLQGENEMLRDQLSRFSSSSSQHASSSQLSSIDLVEKSSSHHSDHDLEDELVRAQREAQMKQLQQSIQSLQSLLDAKKERNEQLQNQLSESNMKILQLEQALSKRPTDEAYNQMKERAIMLEQLAFSSTISTGGTTSTTATSNDGDGNSNEPLQKSVEQLLSEKNRYLENQLTLLKRTSAQAEQELRSVKQELSELRSKCTGQEELIQKLENDLASEQVVVASGGATAPDSVDGDANSHSHGSVVNSGAESSGASGVAVQQQGATTMLQIVSEQRNRFKKRLQELEEENQSLNEKLSRVQSELNTLQKDNVSLYEKIRYLQSYQNVNQQQQTSSSSSLSSSTAVASSDDATGRRHHHHRHADLDLEDPIRDKYKKLYEQKLDPFKQFHKNEKTSEYKKLTAPEKITFSMTRLMLSHKYSRLFVFFYLIALHLLVFAVSYKLTHQPLCGSNHE